MKQLLIILIFFGGGCVGEDKKVSTDDTISETNIEGKQLFNNMCISCHKPDKDFAGPILKGSLKRWGGDKKIYVRIYTKFRRTT